MNCPRCGAVNKKFAIHVTDRIYDSVNKMYYRRCHCSKCGKQFFTVEFEIECDKDILEAFEYAAPPPSAKVESSRKRFNDYRASKKELQKIKRGNRT